MIEVATPDNQIDDLACLIAGCEYSGKAMARASKKTASNEPDELVGPALEVLPQLLAEGRIDEVLAASVRCSTETSSSNDCSLQSIASG